MDDVLTEGEKGYNEAPVSILRADRGPADCALFVILTSAMPDVVRTHRWFAECADSEVEELRCATLEQARAWCRFMETDVLPGRCYVIVNPDFDSFWPVRERWYQMSRPHIRPSKGAYRKAAAQGCYPS